MAVDHFAPIEYQLVEEVPDAALLVLYANGAPCTCPFSPVQPVVTNGQQTGFGRSTCNTGCPLVNVRFEPKEQDYTETKATSTESLPGIPVFAKIPPVVPKQAILETFCAGLYNKKNVTIRLKTSLVNPNGNTISMVN